jgi:hypothetical protein
MILGAVACVAVGFCASARLRTAGLLRAASLAAERPDVADAWARHPGPHPGLLVAAIGALAAFGVAPTLRAGFAALSATIAGFTALARVEPQGKVALMDRTLNDAAGAMEAARTTEVVGLALGIVIAVVLVLLKSPLRGRIRALGRPDSTLRSDEGISWLAAVLVAAGLALTVATSPFRRENETPWPPPAREGDALTAGIDTPSLEGPDALERAPVLTVTATLTALDGPEVAPDQLRRTLSTLLSNYQLLHPDSEFGGQVILLCTPDAPAASVASALGIAADAGYPHATLAFLRKEIVDRPLFGRLERNHNSGAAFTTVAGTPLPAGTVGIGSDAHSTCGDLAREVVAARRRGAKVALVVRPRGDLPEVRATPRPAPRAPAAPPASRGPESAARPARGSAKGLR